MSETIPAPRYTLWQSVAVAVRLGKAALAEVRSLKSSPPVARFPVVEPWADGIHYTGAIVTLEGSTWQALRDTAKAPPGDDWACIAERGGDAPTGSVTGLYSPAKRYRLFDLVAFDGGEWRARKDDPGPLPGDDWALSAVQGKPGRKGETGEPGRRGDRGPAGPSIVDWHVDGYRVAPLFEDGTAGPVLDLRTFFELYNSESK